MATFLTVDDLLLFVPDMNPARAQQMIDDATALAVLAAPCIDDVGFANSAAVKAILRDAILRRHEAGSGALQQQSAGPFAATYDTRQERRGLFWPSEIRQLQSLCPAGSAFTVSLATPDPIYPVV